MLTVRSTLFCKRYYVDLILSNALRDPSALHPTSSLLEAPPLSNRLMDGSLDLRTRRNMARNVSDLDLLDLQKQGQELYRQRKFEDALKCFDQV